MTATDLWAIYKAYVYWMLKMADWGNVPAWVTAVITLGALGAAAYAARQAWKSNQAQRNTIAMQGEQLDLQRQQFQDAREADERAQASKVSFYLPGADMAERVVGHDGKGAAEFSGPNTLFLFNASSSPIFDPVIWDERPEPRLLLELYYLLPTEASSSKVFMYHMKPYPDVECAMFFRDAARVAWVRRSDGSLTKATDEQIALAGRLSQYPYDSSSQVDLRKQPGDET